MATNSASSSHSKASSPDSPSSAALPDAKAARDPQGHFTQAFKLAVSVPTGPELLARTLRLTAERDFLKKCAAYFATPSSGGSK